MKRFIFFILFTLICFNSFSQIQEPDLSFIKTYKDAESFCHKYELLLFKDNLTKEDLVDAYFNLYFLGRRLGMSSMYKEQEYKSYSSAVKAQNSDEEWKLTSLMDEIAIFYNGYYHLTQFHTDALDYFYWMNFDAYHGHFDSHTTYIFLKKI